MIYFAGAIFTPVARVAVIVFDNSITAAAVANPVVRIAFNKRLFCFTGLSLHVKAGEALFTMFALLNVAHSTV